MTEDKGSILLVDDHVENLLALEALLSDLGQNLVRANSGLEALRLLLHQEFALILLDVDMPTINGFETAALIRQRDRSHHTPIIFLTAVNKAERHVFKGYSLGAVDYLTKPFVPEILRSKVIAFVELHRKNEQVKRQAALLQQMVVELAGSNNEIRKLNVELQSERDFISTVLDTADSIIVVLNAEQKIIQASRAFERILGYSLAEVQGRTLDSFFGSAGPSPDLSQAENYWMSRDGTPRLIAWSRTVLNGKDGGPNHFVITGNDITERKRAEEQREQLIRGEAARLEAEAAERRSAFLAEASTMLASTLDYEKTLVNISRLAIPTFAEWCFVYLAQGNEISSAVIAHADVQKEQVARQIEIRLEDLSSTTLPVVRVFETGIPELFSDIHEEELKDTLKDERKFEALTQLGIRSAVVVPMPGRHTVLGVIGFVSPKPNRYGSAELFFAQELARHISFALENARLYREAQEANRAKDEFLATLSHELRTPLNAILGWVQILRAKRLDEITTARAFEAIERNAKAQAELIEDMLDVSRIITGRLRLELQAVELSSAVEGALDSVRPAAEAKGVRLEYMLDPNAGVISGDPHRLQQIVWNLLSNAVKFTPSGGLVRVNLDRLDGEVKLTVRDTGKGISPQFLPYVFDRFRQAEIMISRTSGGLGLGLSIARHLVELHGGVIEASSEGEGCGATFTVTFPFRESLPVIAVQNVS
ncbi:MAG: histidine kinase [Acidobacteria bacterium]|nr:MAG: histidine kinase [Acidobacteriota bacterium]